MIVALCIAGVLSLVMIRFHWLQWQASIYNLKTHYWVVSTKQGSIIADLMTQFWPLTYLRWEIWHWDFRRYAVNQDLYDEMEQWIEEQKRRADLDEGTFEREIGLTESGIRNAVSGTVSHDPSNN